VVAVDAAQVEFARYAFRNDGKGRHPVGLNYGDCFAYALSRTSGEPLLLKGERLEALLLEGTGERSRRIGRRGRVGRDQTRGKRPAGPIARFRDRRMKAEAGASVVCPVALDGNFDVRPWRCGSYGCPDFGRLQLDARP
jgi:hypothetical protein